VPGFLREIVARITFEARAAPEISQSSGVSVRASINNYETLIASAEKRALRCRESEIVPRLTDLPALSASTGGKIELDYGGDSLTEGALVERVVNRAVKATFDGYVDVEQLSSIVEYIAQGWGVAVSDSMPAADYMNGIATVPGLRDAIEALGPYESPGLMASAAELILEGLHLHDKLDREREGGRMIFKA
jgi:magnesium chelatase subunit I